jgi:hypothetical protein
VWPNPESGKKAEGGIFFHIFHELEELENLQKHIKPWLSTKTFFH